MRASVAGGPEGLFLLDTGAAETLLDTRVAEAAHVTLGDPMQLTGWGGETQAHRAEDVPLALDGAGGVLVDPAVINLAPIGQRIGLRLDGVLGDDVLRRFVVTLDYRAGTVRLDEASAVTPPPDAAPLRFLATPFVDATVELAGRKQQAAFQIDTGSNTAVAFWAPFARQALPATVTTPGAGLGVAGEARTALGRIDALIVAGRRIEHPSANFDDHVRPDDAGADYGGVIGGPAWSGLVLTIDFPHRRVWVW